MDSNTLSAFAAVLSVLAVLITAVLSYRQSRESRLQRAEDLATRFREPLLQAAYNLQSRLYNIAKQDFLGRFLTADEASQQERDYAVRNTLYLFGQYLAWVEIIRREAQYVDPRSRENNRAIVERVEHVRDRMADSARTNDRPLRLFRGEQRAVGELMLVPVATPVGDVPRWECLGYAAFVDRLTTDPKFAAWFEPLEQGIETLAKEAPDLPPRITELQHALIDVLDVLDPQKERVPPKFRGKMSEGPA
jgi:hypothetical protein